MAADHSKATARANARKAWEKKQGVPMNQERSNSIEGKIKQHQKAQEAGLVQVVGRQAAQDTKDVSQERANQAESDTHNTAFDNLQEQCLMEEKKQQVFVKLAQLEAATGNVVQKGPPKVTQKLAKNDEVARWFKLKATLETLATKYNSQDRTTTQKDFWITYFRQFFQVMSPHERAARLLAVEDLEVTEDDPYPWADEWKHIKLAPTKWAGLLLGISQNYSDYHECLEGLDSTARSDLGLFTKVDPQTNGAHETSVLQQPLPTFEAPSSGTFDFISSQTSNSSSRFNSRKIVAEMSCIKSPFVQAPLTVDKSRFEFGAATSTPFAFQVEVNPPSSMKSTASALKSLTGVKPSLTFPVGVSISLKDAQGRPQVISSATETKVNGIDLSNLVNDALVAVPIVKDLDESNSELMSQSKDLRQDCDTIQADNVTKVDSPAQDLEVAEQLTPRYIEDISSENGTVKPSEPLEDAVESSDNDGWQPDAHVPYFDLTMCDDTSEISFDGNNLQDANDRDNGFTNGYAFRITSKQCVLDTDLEMQDILDDDIDNDFNEDLIEDLVDGQEYVFAADSTALRTTNPKPKMVVVSYGIKHEDDANYGYVNGYEDLMERDQARVDMRTGEQTPDDATSTRQDAPGNSCHVASTPDTAQKIIVTKSETKHEDDANYGVLNGYEYLMKRDQELDVTDKEDDSSEDEHVFGADPVSQDTTAMTSPALDSATANSPTVDTGMIEDYIIEAFRCVAKASLSEKHQQDKKTQEGMLTNTDELLGKEATFVVDQDLCESVLTPRSSTEVYGYPASTVSPDEEDMVHLISTLRVDDHFINQDDVAITQSGDSFSPLSLDFEEDAECWADDVLKAVVGTDPPPRLPKLDIGHTSFADLCGEDALFEWLVESPKKPSVLDDELQVRLQATYGVTKAAVAQLEPPQSTTLINRAHPLAREAVLQKLTTEVKADTGDPTFNSPEINAFDYF
jgi:hypothetical protein